MIVGWIEFGNYRKVGLKSDGANLHANPHRLGTLIEEGNIIELFRLLLINFTLSWDERKKKILIQGRAKKFLCPLISLLLFFFPSRHEAELSFTPRKLLILSGVLEVLHYDGKISLVRRMFLLRKVNLFLAGFSFFFYRSLMGREFSYSIQGKTNLVF